LRSSAAADDGRQSFSFHVSAYFPVLRSPAATGRRPPALVIPALILGITQLRSSAAGNGNRLFLVP